MSYFGSFVTAAHEATKWRNWYQQLDPERISDRRTKKIYRPPTRKAQRYAGKRYAGLQDFHAETKHIPKYKRNRQDPLNPSNLGKNSNSKETSTMPPRARRYNNRRRPYRRKPRVPRPLSTKFPGSQLVKLTSYHMVSIDPAASSAVAYATVNLNNPEDPIGTLSNFSLISTEHKPKYYDLYESIYDKVETISAKVSCHFVGWQATVPHTYVVVPASHENKDETLTMLTDTNTFAPRLKESNKRAIVKVHASSTNESDNLNLFTKVNIRKLEGIKKNSSDASLLQGTTSASGTATAPTRAPVAYIAVGSFGSADNQDIPQSYATIKIEQVFLFSALTGDTEGVAI